MNPLGKLNFVDPLSIELSEFYRVLQNIICIYYKE